LAVGTTATVIAISYLVLVVVGIVIAVVLVRTTRARRSEIDAEKLAKQERAWLGVVIALLVALLLSTIFFIPYGASAGPDPQVVRVDSVQYGWTVEPDTVKAGTPVEFLLTSQDTNHGFGVYNEDGVLLFQVQIIPGETQKGVYTFEQPGTYEILCLEFCGVGHHLMRSQLTVEPA
jgi:cytochrome c oxidase subunit 2